MPIKHSNFLTEQDVVALEDQWFNGPKEYWCYVINPRGCASYLVWTDEQTKLYSLFTYMTAAMYFCCGTEQGLARTHFLSKAIPFANLASQTLMKLEKFVTIIEALLKPHEQARVTEDKITKYYDQHGYMGHYADLFKGEHSFCRDIRRGFRRDDCYDELHTLNDLIPNRPIDDYSVITDNEKKLFDNFVTCSI